MEKKNKIYISGKISGLDENEAFKMFEEAEITMSALGFEVVNPMKLPHNHDKTWLSYMREDVKALVDCDAIYMLPNWTDSKGALAEFRLAVSLGLEIHF